MLTFYPQNCRNANDVFNKYFFFCIFFSYIKYHVGFVLQIIFLHNVYRNYDIVIKCIYFKYMHFNENLIKSVFQVLCAVILQLIHRVNHSKTFFIKIMSTIFPSRINYSVVVIHLSIITYYCAVLRVSFEKPHQECWAVNTLHFFI